MRLRSLLSYWAALSATCWCAPILAESPSDAPKPGLPWVQFHSPDFTRPAESGVDPRIDLDTGTQIQGYSRVWKGLVKFPTTGKVLFRAEADDGLELWLDGKLLIDGWGPQRQREGSCTGEADKLVPVEIRFYQNGGTAHLRLFWSLEGKPQEPIPASAFWHREGDRRVIDDLMAGKASVGPSTEDKSSLYAPGTRAAGSAAGPIRLGPGPHLFVDDYLIESCSGISRKVNRPERQLAEPVVTGSKGKGDNCFQPYLSVLRDPQTRRFRIWYGVPESAGQSHIGYMESEDGIHWIRPHRVLADPARITFGVSVFDEGPDYPDATKRYKYGWWNDGGLQVASSPDGLTWKPIVPGVVLWHNHDINNIYRDRVRNRYMAIVSTYITGPRWSGLRRVTMQSISDDLIHWQRPWWVVTPDDKVEAGETQFYAMCGFLQRGDLLIGMVKVLHDDFSADPGGPKAGVGWTSLAWTRDGEHWVRDREVFFDRHPESGQWDHAMAWIDWQLPVGDEVYLYYGGYANGHKVNRFEERQIGLLRMTKDRYVAREAGEAEGLLRTPPVVMAGATMTVNANVEGGLRVRLLDESGAPLAGFDWTDCTPIKGDCLSHAVAWKGGKAPLPDKPIRLEFSLTKGRLYGFELAGGSAPPAKEGGK